MKLDEKTKISILEMLNSKTHLGNWTIDGNNFTYRVDIEGGVYGNTWEVPALSKKLNKEAVEREALKLLDIQNRAIARLFSKWI